MLSVLSKPPFMALPIAVVAPIPQVATLLKRSEKLNPAFSLPESVPTNLSDEELFKIEIVDPYSRTAKVKGKVGILDLKLKTKSGSKICIKIQVLKHISMLERVLWQATSSFSNEAVSGEDYGNLKKTIAVVISVDHIIMDDRDGYIHNFKLKDDFNKEYPKSLLKMHFFELMRIPEEDLKNDSELMLWVKFLKGKKEEEFNMLSVKSPVMNKAVTVLKNLNVIEKERLVAWDRERDEMMMKSEIKYAKEEGKAEGENKKALEIAKNMLKDNIKKEIISKFTGLSVPEIDSID